MEFIKIKPVNVYRKKRKHTNSCSRSYCCCINIEHEIVLKDFKDIKLNTKTIESKKYSVIIKYKGSFFYSIHLLAMGVKIEDIEIIKFSTDRLIFRLKNINGTFNTYLHENNN